jgi:hypothetical protein
MELSTKELPLLNPTQEKVLNLVLSLQQAVECLEAIAKVTTPNQYMMDSITSGNAALQEFLK